MAVTHVVMVGLVTLVLAILVFLLKFHTGTNVIHQPHSIWKQAAIPAPKMPNSSDTGIFSDSPGTQESCKKGLPELRETCGGRQLRAGYVLVLRDWEQQTAGSANLMSLQCWAATMNMVVVEYFMSKSMYMVPSEILNGTASPQQVVRVRDLYNISYWNEYSTKECYAPLISWEEFLCNAPREVILVHIAYDWLNDFQGCPPEQRYIQIFERKYTPFFSVHGFKIVREVCIKTREPMSTKTFNSKILGQTVTSQVTVMINLWRGTENNGSKRVVMSDTRCCRHSFSGLPFAKPSAKVLEHVRQYRAQVLQGNDYIAVMVRLEHAIVHLHSEPLTTWSPSQCLKGIVSLVRDTKQQYDLNETFWSLDVGKYGTVVLKKWYDSPGSILQEVLSFMQEHYNVSYSDVEASLTGVSGMTHAGYIAALQMNVAARAKCLVLIGGGSFHEYSKRSYESLHSGPRCVIQKDMEWLKQHCYL